MIMNDFLKHENAIETEVNGLAESQNLKYEKFYKSQHATIFYKIALTLLRFY